MTLLIPRPKTLLIVSLIVLGVIIYFTAHVVANSRPGFYENCADAAAHHDTNIPSSSRFYRIQLDRDKNGIACQT